MPDAVVIGAGPNGLVAANLLADAGWDVLVCETRPHVGGAVHSSDSVAAGFIHDTASSFYPLAAASPAIRRLRLDRHGLVWSHAPAVLGHPRHDGPWAVLHRDATRTAEVLDLDHPGDGDAWLRMTEVFGRIGPDIVGALLSPLPPVRSTLRALTKLRRAGGLDLVQMCVAPLGSLARETFGGRSARMLLAGNALHADIPLDAPGSGFFGWLLSMLGQHVGFPVPRGGAGALSEAMARRLEECGGRLRCSTRVEQVVVERGRAVGVRTEHGDLVPARRAVVADVVAPNLYGGLVDWAHLPARMRRRMARFEWDPGTVKVDWALDGPIPWAGAPERMPGTVHVAESMAELAMSGHQVRSGVTPEKPFLIVGQMTTSDPVRSPAGTESAWAYTHVPSDADVDLVTERVERRLDEYAPGFRERVVARRVLGPRDLEEYDENLVGGAINGGTASLHQQLVFRPVPGSGRAETPVRGLYLGSSSAHPGGGVHGACGANAARAALTHARFDPRLR